MFEQMRRKAGFKEEDGEYVWALFLHTLGPEGLGIYNTMNLPEYHKVKDIMKDGQVNLEDAHAISKGSSKSNSKASARCQFCGQHHKLMG